MNFLGIKNDISRQNGAGGTIFGSNMDETGAVGSKGLI
jgi:hypothetical protein